MDVRGISQPINKIDADAIAVAVFKGEKPDERRVENFGQGYRSGDYFNHQVRRILANEGETAYFHLTDSGLQARGSLDWLRRAQ